MKKKINISALLKIIIYLKFLPAIMVSIKNWPTFLLYYLGLKDGAFECIFRNGIKIAMNDNIGCVTIAVIFIKKDYGNVPENSTIIDIGANIGAYAIFAAKRGNKVYAFEPMTNNFELLKNNIRINNLSSIIFPYNFAIAGKREQRNLYLGESPFHSLYPVSQSPFNALYQNRTTLEQNFTMISCISLEDVFLENNINKCDILKIDCEGAEYEILYHLPDEYFKKIKEIRLEYHNHATDPKNTGDALKRFLVGKGFVIVKDKKASGFQGDLWFKNNQHGKTL